jgi:hypothetical protein
MTSLQSERIGYSVSVISAMRPSYQHRSAAPLLPIFPNPSEWPACPHGAMIAAMWTRLTCHDYSRRPGDPLALDMIRAPAIDFAHLFHPLAARQLRGITWPAPILLRLHELDQYEDAALVKAKVAALLISQFFAQSKKFNAPSAEKDAQTDCYPSAASTSAASCSGSGTGKRTLKMMPSCRMKVMRWR